MPMTSPFLHCMWSDWKSRLSLTRGCVILSFSQGWTLLRPVVLACGLVDPPCTIWTRLGPVFDPCWNAGHLWIIGGPFVDQGWIIYGFLWTIGELLVEALLDRIGFLGHFVIHSFCGGLYPRLGKSACVRVQQKIVTSGGCSRIMAGEIGHGFVLFAVGARVISSLGFQTELFVSLPCSEGLEGVLSLEVSAGWLENGKN